MHRTEADGNTNGLYTEGDAALGVPATVFSSAAANSFQEEIVSVVLASGQTLQTRDTDTFNQLLEAVKVLIQTGGNTEPSTQPIGNAQVDQDLIVDGSVLEFDSALIKSASYSMNLVRNTDSQSLVESGKLSMTYEPKNGVWLVESSTSFDDAGISFEMAVTTAGKAKVTYSTTDVTGTSYFGELTLSNYQETRV